MMKSIKAFWNAMFQLMGVFTILIDALHDIAEMIGDETKAMRKESQLERAAEMRKLESSLE